MERARLSVGDVVKVRPAGGHRRSRTATRRLGEIMDKDLPRPQHVQIRWVDSGEVAAVRINRITEIVKS